MEKEGYFNEALFYKMCKGGETMRVKVQSV